MCRLLAADEPAPPPPTRTGPRPARHARVRPPAPASASRQSTAAWSTTTADPVATRWATTAPTPPTARPSGRTARHRYGVHEVFSGLRFFLVDEPLPENSLILDHRHAPASVAVLSA